METKVEQKNDPFEVALINGRSVFSALMKMQQPIVEPMPLGVHLVSIEPVSFPSHT